MAVDVARAHADERRDAFALLSRGVTAAVVVVLLAASAAAWLATTRTAASMDDMALGLGQVGERMPNDMTVPTFMVMWITMMIAMMFPTVAPIVLSHRAVVRRRGEGTWPTITFVAGYIVVWSVIGLLPLAALLSFRSASMDAASSWWLPTLAGAIIAVAGAYQFSTWKARCLRTCRSPMTFLMTHDWGGGVRSAFRAGISHGAYCLGCCWALMAVLVVVGLMNLVWMAALSLIFVAEKNWRHGAGLTRLAGGALIGLGVAIVATPSILPTIAAA